MGSAYTKIVLVHLSTQVEASFNFLKIKLLDCSDTKVCVHVYINNMLIVSEIPGIHILLV